MCALADVMTMGADICCAYTSTSLRTGNCKCCEGTEFKRTAGAAAKAQGTRARYSHTHRYRIVMALGDEAESSEPPDGLVLGVTRSLLQPINATRQFGSYF